MDTFAILIIMASGFMFTSRYPLARFKQLRSSGWLLYFHIFVWGLLFSSLAVFAVWGLYSAFNIDKCIRRIWVGRHFNDSFSFAYFLWSMLSICLAWGIGKYLENDHDVINNATLKCAEEDSFRYKIFNATKNGELIQVTLKNRKVYVGVILSFNELKNPNAKFIKIAPTYSGYRREEDLVINYTNSYWCNYEQPFKKIEEEMNNDGLSIKDNPSIFAEKISNELEEFMVVIPISEIVSLGNFDPEIYKSTNNNIK